MNLEDITLNEMQKWLSEEALQIAVKRREAKSKEEKERYTHLNAEFQRTASRDNKKAFLSNQCKEIEENNRMGKTRQKILRRGGKNTQNCTKKIFTTQIITMVRSFT